MKSRESNIDLCRSLISADNPLYIIRNEIHRAAKVARGSYPEVDLLISSVKYFSEPPSRINILKYMYPEIPLSPKPSFIRWCTLLEAVECYAERIDCFNN